VEAGISSVSFWQNITGSRRKEGKNRKISQKLEKMTPPVQILRLFLRFLLPDFILYIF
jgi:hypothetical protein